MPSKRHPDKRGDKSSAQILLQSELIDVTLVEPLIDSRGGEMEVTLTNPRRKRWQDVVVRLKEVGASDGVRRFSILPSYADGGYRIDEIPPLGSLARRFSLRPLHADVGSVTEIEVSLEFRDAQELKAVFSVRVEARPEVYAALGAAEWLRERLLAGYEELEQTGRRTHRKLGGSWPSPESLEPARLALGEESFRKLFEVLQLGARVADGISRKPGGGSGGDKSS